MSIRVFDKAMTFFRSGIIRRLSPSMGRFLILSALTLAGTLSGLTVSSWQTTSALQPNWAYAQSDSRSTITDDEVVSYARSVLQMETNRNNAYSEIKAMMVEVGLNIGDFEISCTNSRLSDIPRSIRRQVQQVIVDYCNNAASIVSDNGMEAERFNTITSAHRQDPTLAERIRQAMIELQQQ